MADPTLKLIVAWSDRRNLCSIVRDAMVSLVGTDDVLLLGDDALAVYTADATGALRDHLRAKLEPGDQLLVTEFEVWSSFGEGVDARWLLARGH